MVSALGMEESSRGRARGGCFLNPAYVEPSRNRGQRVVNSVVRSFDVFDTSLTRLVGRPSAVFFLQGHVLVCRGLWKASAEQFAAARLEAERRARHNAGGQEVTLKAIYRE